MNHSEVGPSPGHANTAAFPFSFLMPVGRGGYPSAAADAFADLFAQLSRPQTSASRDQAATRPSQTQRPVTGNDSDPGNDDDATEDASPAPAPARDPLSQPLGEFDEGTPAATATPPPPPVATDGSDDRTAWANDDADAGSAADEPGASEGANPSPASHDRTAPVPVDGDARQNPVGDGDGDETHTDHDNIALVGKPRPGGDPDRPESSRPHGSRPDTDPRSASPPEIVHVTGSVGRGQAGEPPSETPQADDGKGTGVLAGDAPPDRFRRQRRRDAGREPSEREARASEAREARGSQPLVDSRPMAGASAHGVTTSEQASDLAFHEQGANPSEPPAASGGGAGRPDAAMPSVGPGGAPGVPKSASGLSSPGSGETAPTARAAAPDAGTSSFDGHATSRGHAAPTSSPSAAEAEGPIDVAARVRLIQRVSRAFQQLGASGGIVRMKLAPPELGSIRIEMRVQDRQVEARVVAESEAASQLIREHLPELRQRLESQGLRVERLDVRNEADAESWADGDWPHGERDDRPSQGDGGQHHQPSERRRGQPPSLGDRTGNPSRGPTDANAGPAQLATTDGRPGIDASW